MPWLLIALVAILFTLGILGSLEAVLGPDAMKGWFDVFQGDEQSPGQPAAPEKVKVPDVAGLTRSVAEHRLNVAGLEVGQVSSFSSDSVAAGRVIAQGIAAGTPVKPNTEVNLDISTGPQPSSAASSSASAQSSPQSGAASASSSASAQPAPREDRQTIERPVAKEHGPKANVPKTKVQKSPPARQPKVAEPASNSVDNGGNQGRSANPGHGGGQGKD